MSIDTAPEAIAHRGRCRVHPDARFPIRADITDALEDTATHVNERIFSGGHTVSVELIELHEGETPSADLHGFPPNYDYGPPL